MIYLELFYVFFLIGLFTFGGGYAMIPLIEHETISRGWLTEETFLNLISISESSPGPIAVNTATFVGNIVKGPFGAIMATLGVILPSFIIILLIATVVKHLTLNPIFQAILKGIKGVVIGLILAMAIWFLYQNVFINSEGGFTFLWKPFIILIIVVLVNLIFKLIKKSISPYITLIISGILGLIIYTFL